MPTSNFQAANVVLGQPSHTGITANNGGLSESTLNFPRTITTYNDKLLTMDKANNRILVWNQVPTTSGTDADHVIGQADFTTATTGTTVSTLNSPFDVYVDEFTMAIADNGNHRVIFKPNPL